MTTDMKKTVTTSLSASELVELDRVCERGGLSRAAAVRAAIRWYIGAAGRLPPAEDPTPEEMEAIKQGEAEFARGECRSLEDVQHELGLPTE